MAGYFTPWTSRFYLALVLLLLGTLAFVGMVLTVTSDASSQQEGVPASLVFEEGSYSVVFRSYHRFGPMKETYHKLNLAPHPETTLQQESYKIDEKGYMYDHNVTLHDDITGELWVSHTSPLGDVLVTTKHRTAEVTTSPIEQAPLQRDGLIPGDTPTLKETLLASGFKVIRNDVLDGDPTEVLENFHPVGEAVIPQEGDYIVPVMYDLDPVTLRIEYHLDATTGALRKVDTYAVDAERKETLVQSFESILPFGRR